MNPGAGQDAGADAAASHAVVPPSPGTPAASDARRTRTPRRSHLARDLTLIVVGCLALLGLMGAGAVWTYRSLYTPSAFVSQYLHALAAHDAPAALAMPGVAIDRAQLSAAGMPKNASEALLRRAALGSLTDIHIASETAAGDVTRVTASYRAGGHAGRTTFEVAPAGHIGVLPLWRFAQSPLTTVDLTVQGSMNFIVNGFTLDKRQVPPAGSTVDPSAPVPLLVFTPGLYSLRVDNAMSHAPGLAVLADVTMTTVPVEVVSTPTAKFVDVVRTRVDDFLTQCATQQVLQPTGCPFGKIVQNRIEGPPHWSITKAPTVDVVADGDRWRIPEAHGTAHIVVDIQSLYDGSVQHVDEDVPFALTGTIDVSADGTASIQISPVDDD